MKKLNNIANEIQKTIKNDLDYKAVVKIFEHISKILPHFMFIRDIKHINEISASKELQEAFFIWTDFKWDLTMQKIHDHLEQKSELFKWEELNNRICAEVEKVQN